MIVRPSRSCNLVLMTKDKRGKGQNKKGQTSAIVTAKDVVQTVAAAGGAAAAAVTVPATAQPSVLALAAVLVALFPSALAAVTEAGARRLKARAERFYESIVDAWAADGSTTREEIAGKLEAAKDDPDIADAIWRAIRGLMDAPNDAAAVPLGVLAAEYAKEGRPADAFFRGCVRLLQELSEAEHAELRALLKWVTTATARESVDLVARRGAIDAALDQHVQEPGVDGRPEMRTDTTAVSDPARLFDLLTANGLAVQLRHARFDVSLPEIMVRRSIATRLLTILGRS